MNNELLLNGASPQMSNQGILVCNKKITFFQALLHAAETERSWRKQYW